MNSNNPGIVSPELFNNWNAPNMYPFHHHLEDVVTQYSSSKLTLVSVDDAVKLGIKTTYDGDYVGSASTAEIGISNVSENCRVMLDSKDTTDYIYHMLQYNDVSGLQNKFASTGLRRYAPRINSADQIDPIPYTVWQISKLNVIKGNSSTKLFSVPINILMCAAYEYIPKEGETFARYLNIYLDIYSSRPITAL